jgi:cytidylate kinase
MVITVSRQYGAGGSEVAARVAEGLGWSVVDNELIEKVAARAGVTADEVAEREERVPGFIERLGRTLAAASPELFPPPGGTIEELSEEQLVRITEGVVAELAAQGKVVMVGRAAPAVLGDERALHVKLVAPLLFRVQRTMERLGITAERARKIVDDMDSHRLRYHREYYQRDWADPLNYHMTLNTGRIGMGGAVGVIMSRANVLWPPA